MNSQRMKKSLHCLGICAWAWMAIQNTASAQQTGSGLGPLYDPEVESFCKIVTADLDAGRFEDLETIAQQAQTLKERFVGGRPRLQEFYYAIITGKCNAASCCLSLNGYVQRIDLIERWRSARPDSPAARIAMAEIWKNYAWRARGNDYASQVAPERWRLFSERMQKAGAYMSGVDANYNPQAYLVLLDLALATKHPREGIDAVFKAATAVFPTYFAYYGHYADMLQPKWFGRPGDVALFADSLTLRPVSENGAVAYSFVAAKLAHQYYLQDFFEQSGLNWVKVKEGFTARDKLYGLSIHDWNDYCYMALAASDRATAKLAYDHFGENWDPSVWDSADFFYQFLLWIVGTAQ